MNSKELKLEQFNQILKCLNSAHECDPAVQTIFNNRVPCGEALVDHPYIVVGEGKHGENLLSPLGVLNGVLSSAGFPKIAMKYNDQTNVFEGFVKYQE